MECDRTTSTASLPWLHASGDGEHLYSLLSECSPSTEDIIHDGQVFLSVTKPLILCWRILPNGVAVHERTEDVRGASDKDRYDFARMQHYALNAPFYRPMPVVHVASGRAYCFSDKEFLVRVRDMHTGAVLACWTRTEEGQDVFAILPSPDGKLVALDTTLRTTVQVEVRDAATGFLVRVFPGSMPIYAGLWRFTGDSIFVGGHWYCVSSGRRLADVEMPFPVNGGTDLYVCKEKHRTVLRRGLLLRQAWVTCVVIWATNRLM